MEQYLGGTHVKLKIGITDVTTDTLHAEIKVWEDWKMAVGQLTCYNNELPKEELHLYCFGKYGEKAKKAAVENINHCGIKVYEFRNIEQGIEIYNLNTKEVVYTFEVT